MKSMSQYEKPLDNAEWAELYNINSLNAVVGAIESGNVSVWSEELRKIAGGG